MNTQAQQLEALRAAAAIATAAAEQARLDAVAAQEAANRAGREAAEAEAKAKREADMRAKWLAENALRVQRLTKVFSAAYGALIANVKLGGEDDFFTSRGYTFDRYGDNNLDVGLVNARFERTYLGRLYTDDTLKTKRVKFGDKVFTERKDGSYNTDLIATEFRAVAMQAVWRAEKKMRADSNSLVRDNILRNAKVKSYDSPIHAETFEHGMGRGGRGETRTASAGKLFFKVNREVTHEQAEKLLQVMVEMGLVETH